MLTMTYYSNVEEENDHTFAHEVEHHSFATDITCPNVNSYLWWKTRIFQVQMEELEKNRGLMLQLLKGHADGGSARGPG